MVKQEGKKGKRSKKESSKIPVVTARTTSTNTIKGRSHLARALEISKDSAYLRNRQSFSMAVDRIAAAGICPFTSNGMHAAQTVMDDII
jgi:hypothetical protein